jgi:predicted component of type VI protein secretion system
MSMIGESVVAFNVRKKPSGRRIMDESHIPPVTSIAPFSADFSPIMEMI